MASALLAAALYSVTLWGTYVYDDRFIVRDDPRLHDLVLHLEYFTTPYFTTAKAADPLWRPLTSLTYVWHWRLHGEAAWPRHLVNILLHAGVSALVAALGCRLGGPAVGWIAGLLFAAHPVHVEAVAYIVGRAETLSALGVVGGLVVFAGGPLTGRRIWGICGCLVLGALSKEHGILLAPMLLVMHLSRKWAGDGAPAASSRELRGRQWLLALMCLLFCAYTFARESVGRVFFDVAHLPWNVNPVVRAEGIHRVLVPITALGRYVEMLVMPWRLSPDYGALVTNYFVRWSDAYLWVGLAAMVGWGVMSGVFIGRRCWRGSALLLCMAGSYFLISNSVILIGTIMGDRLIYLSSVFFILLLAMGLARLPRKARTVIIAAMLIAASYKTVSQAWRWNDALRLYSMSRAEFPHSAMLHALEAGELVQLGRLDEASRILAEARKLNDEVHRVYELSAIVEEMRGNHEEANRYDRRAFELSTEPPHVRKAGK